MNLGEAKLTVLGTVFNAKSCADSQSITTTLVAGSVRFETPTQTIVLKPNQQVSYHKASDKIEINTVETDLLTAWKDNLIKYRAITFEDFTKLPEAHYGVRIKVFNEQLASQVISGSFESDLGISSILDILQTNLSFRWNKQDEVYIIQ